MMINAQSCLARLSDILGTELIFNPAKQVVLVIDNRLFISLHFKSNTWIVYGMVHYYNELYRNHLPVQYWQDLLQLNLEYTKQNLGALCFFQQNSSLLYVDFPKYQISDGDELYSYLTSYIENLENIKLITKPNRYMS